MREFLKVVRNPVVLVFLAVLIMVISCGSFVVYDDYSPQRNYDYTKGKLDLIRAKTKAMKALKDRLPEQKGDPEMFRTLKKELAQINTECAVQYATYRSKMLHWKFDQVANCPQGQEPLMDPEQLFYEEIVPSKP